MIFQQNYLNKYIEELSKTKLLTSEEEYQLWQEAANSNPQSFTKLATAYQPLVFSQVRKFKVPYETIMELIQEGTVALIESAERYNYKSGIAFSVFATSHIRGAIINYLKKENANSLLQYLEEEITPEFTLGESIKADIVPFENNLFQKYIKQKVQNCINRLPIREKQIVIALYLEEKTAKETAQQYKLSLGSIYRLEKKGKQRLRGMLSQSIKEIRIDYNT